MDKVIKDGKVAVLISGGYGAGWSTWNIELSDEMVFCPEIVNSLLQGGGSEYDIASKLFPDAYLGGLDGLYVGWVKQGCRFEISEYDGAETLRVFGGEDGYIA